MTALGYVFIAVAALLIRQVVVGRVVDTPTDLRDLYLALIGGDMDAAREVTSRRGENVPGVSSGTLTPGTKYVPEDFTDPSASPIGEAYAARCRALGEAARGYVLGAEGPTYYDCSGLMWRAMKDMNIYEGPRYTTSSFQSIAGNFSTKVSSPVTGDVILWPGRHMGVSLGGDRMYSARSTSKGIGESTVSGDSGYFGSQPVYYRITAREG